MIIALLASRISVSDECINLTFEGVESALQKTAHRQIVTEISVPVHLDDGPPGCWQLSIELKNATAQILLFHQRTYNTTIQLHEVAAVLWPRALALSSSGLWILAHEQPDANDSQNTSTPQQMRPEDTVPSLPKTQKDVSNTPHSKSRTVKPGRRSKWHNRTNGNRYRFLFHTATGVRALPSLRTGFLDVSAGMSVLYPRIRFDLSLIGVWGRKSLNAGKIFTTGAGLRAALYWQTAIRKKSVLGIGPAVETLGIFGYGEGNDGIDAHQDFSPVVNMYLSGGGWRTISPSVTGHIIIGAGYSLVHFNMQLDNKNVAGVSGASTHIVLGFSFGSENAN